MKNESIFEENDNLFKNELPFIQKKSAELNSQF